MSKKNITLTGSRNRSMVLGVGLLAATMNPAFAATQPAASAELEKITVRGSKPVRSGYKAPNTTIGKRLQDVQNIPQSATVINQQVIKDQATSDLKEALKNAGITFQAGEGGQTEVPIIRGLHAGGDVYDDGLRGSAAEFNSDTFNTDHIEVLKGSAAVLFGRGAAGGVINQVSKTPYIGTGGDVALGVGNRNYKRLTGDFNHAFNDDVAVRLNIVGEDKDSFRKPVDSRKFGIAPSISVGLSSNTQFDLGYKFEKSDKFPDLGVTYRSTGSNTAVADDRLINKNFGYPDIDFEKRRNHTATAKLRHNFNDDTTLTNTLRYAKTDYDYLVLGPRWNGNQTQIRRRLNDYKNIKYDSNTWSNHTDFNIKFDTGPVKHDLLANLELTQEKRNNYRLSNTFFRNGIQVVPGNNGVLEGSPYDVGSGKFLSNDRFTVVQNPAHSGVLTTRTIGVGLNDIVELTPTVKAIAGVRFNRINTKNEALIPSRNNKNASRSDNIWTYNGSVIWDYLPGHNVYATYSTAATPVAYRVTGQPDALEDAQLVAEPEKTRTVEVGTKNAFFDDALTVNAALFHTKKTQQYYRDAGFIDWSKVYGLDLEVAGRITDRLNVLGNVIVSNGSMKATSPSTKQLNGHFPEAAAKFTANLWTNYRITDNVNAGLGIRHVGDRYTHSPNNNGSIVQKLPAYTAVDAMTSYENRKYRAQLNVNNVFDKKHFTTGHRRQAIPGDRRTVLATFGYKF
ncbi:MAG: TonB-dependent siderophore receptor [Neisseria animaloris]|nr:TonB-dependent siderophore receptor [Neisseria animaloris]